MINLACKKTRFISLIDNYFAFYQMKNNNFINKKEQLFYSVGALNSIWNTWNIFWRYYWIAHVKGGINMDCSLIQPINKRFKTGEVCCFLKKTLNNKLYRVRDSIQGYQEPVWGDVNIIIDLATSLSMYQIYPHLNYLPALISSYEKYLIHFQIIRNKFVHLNNTNLTELKQKLQGDYIFKPDQNIIDFLNSITLSNRLNCFDNLIANMKGLILNL
ncbi:MAG: hypothetical protein ACYCSQ_04885 [bacterium]